MNSKQDMQRMIDDVISALNEMKDDNTVPKNVKGKIDAVILALNEPCEAPMRVHKALNELDEVSDDNNIQAYTRAQLWNVVSMLERIC
jgi:uncharacterized protein (UPF0147 family)